MARLISVNVGLPRDVEWKGRIVHTGIWKDPVPGRCRAGRLNLAGDGQGDLGGHGGEQRAVFVYQTDSYRYWAQELRRNDFVHGQFGENFTVEGLPDDEVCIGDRYEIGTALFEVTQPRVTCYRVGIRMNEPRMPALLTSRGRPGFYFRVLREGEVGAGDPIVKVSEGPENMTVAQINSLLYAPGHDPVQLGRALKICALSPGWRASFDAMVHNHEPGNAGLMPEAASHPAVSGFRPLQVAAIHQESADVISLTLCSPDAQTLPLALPGQYVVVRLRPGAESRQVFRSYSLSGPPSTTAYRISAKIEPNGVAGAYFRQRLQEGDLLDVSSPRGSFTLQDGDRPVVLLSAGIGTTPVLAMLHGLSTSHSTRKILWLQAARDGDHHPFSAEVGSLLPTLANSRSYICYSSPTPRDRVGSGFDAAGHFSRSAFESVGLPPDADVYLCGPNRFMEDMKSVLLSLGVEPRRIYREIFNGGESLTPGIAATPRHPPHPPAGEAAAGYLVSFARSGVSTHWSAAKYQSLLELAEACDVPVRWSCRSGVCHNCESGLVSGAIDYSPEPLERPVIGNLLVCCSQPTTDVVLDL
ncbi:MAG TPA: MOSC and FAD-binding oxidoreductase domain-containing protein [Steroidobacteraceae bacterium]|jgi:MOSC domain-containing protein YiiM/ferredoxin-NADP reductase